MKIETKIDFTPFFKENESRLKQMENIKFSHTFHDRPTHVHCRDVCSAVAMSTSFGSNWTASGRIDPPVDIPRSDNIHPDGMDVTVLHPYSVGPGRKYEKVLRDAGFIQLVGPSRYKDVICLAAMAHDWGKVETFDPEGGEKGRSFFQGHEKVSAQILADMGAPELVCNLVREHGNIRQVDKMTTKGMKKIINRLTPEGCDDDQSRLQVILMFDHLLLADSSAFSAEGKRIARYQWNCWRNKAIAYLTQ